MKYVFNIFLKASKSWKYKNKLAGQTLKAGTQGGKQNTDATIALGAFVFNIKQECPSHLAETT